MNHGSGTGVQGMATAANITKSEKKKKTIPNLQSQTSQSEKKNNTKFANSDFLYEYLAYTHF